MKGLDVVPRNDLSYEQLQKQNRILKRKLGNLQKEVKVDVQKLRQDSLKEGYQTAEAQYQPFIEENRKLKRELKSLQEVLQSHAILY